MKKKYELTEDTIVHEGVKLHRIRASRDFGKDYRQVRKGDLGGFIEKTDNLSHKWDCWIGGNAKVYNDACVFEDARVGDHAQVFNVARVGGRAGVFEFAKIYGYAHVLGSTHIYGNAKVYGHALVADGACVYEYAKISGSVFVFEDASVEGDYEVSGREILGGFACYGGRFINLNYHY